MLDRRLAVWRDQAGRLYVVDDVCPHRGTSLSLGAITGAGRLRCPYHGWAFEGSGRCIRIPQLPAGRTIPRQADVQTYRASEHAGLVWTCLVREAEELRPRPTWAAAEGAGRLHVGEVYDWQVQAFRQLENFCDVAHFSILHADTFGNPATEVVEPFRVEVSNDGWRISFDFPYEACDPTHSCPAYPMVFEYRVDMPFSVALGNASGPGTWLCMASSPLSQTETRVFWVCGFPPDVEVDPERYEALEARIWNPDRAVVESQHPRELPLASLDELHLPFDRFAVVYRRRLKEIGF